MANYIQKQASRITESFDSLTGLEGQLKADIDGILKQMSGLIPAAYGSLFTKRVSCSKPSCMKCPHGPYYYSSFRRDGKVKTGYWSKKPPEDLFKGIRDYRRYKELQAQLEVLQGKQDKLYTRVNDAMSLLGKS